VTVGALLLVANFTVTAAMSGWAAMSYFRVPKEWINVATVGVILLIGLLNGFGAKHSGSVAVTLAMPMVLVVGCIVVLSLPHLTVANLEPSHMFFQENWVAFVGVILALSGSFTVTVDDGCKRTEHRLDRPEIGLHIPSLIWHELHGFSTGAVCAVFASEERCDQEDYCRDYQQFLQARKARSKPRALP